MRSHSIPRWAAGATLALICAQTLSALGDEPSRLGRLFRFGSSSDSKTSSTTIAPGPAASPPASSSSSPTSPSRSVADYYGQPALATQPSAPSGPLGPRITPKPRVNKAITEADPLVSRISVGRADGGEPVRNVHGGVRRRHGDRQPGCP